MKKPGASSYIMRLIRRDEDLLTKTSTVFNIAWPSIVELILVSLCSMVDSVMVGRLSPYAIAAVGLTNQPRFIIQSTFVALNVGSTALIARFRGANDPASANLVLRQSLLLTGILAVILSALGFIFAEPLVVFMGAQSEQTLNWSMDYMRVSMCYFPIMAISLAVTAALRGVGNTKASMVLNLGANVINLIFNYLLIYGTWIFPRWEVFGAAIATGLGQLFACLGGLFILSHSAAFIGLHKGDSFKPNPPMIKRMLRIGGPSMVEQIAMRVGMMVFTLTITSLGELAFATHNITMSVMDLSFMNGTAFGIAATTLVGQSMGRNAPDDAAEYIGITQRMAQVVSVVIALVFFFLGRNIISIFVSEATAEDMAYILGTGAFVLKIVAFLQPFQSAQMVITGSLRGVGDTRYTAIVISVCLVVIRPLLSVLAVQILQWGLIGAYFAMFTDQFIRFFLVYFRYRSGKWKTIKV